MQPLDTSRGHSTTYQLQKKNSHARIISSNSWCALFLSKFRVQCFSSVVSVVFVSRQRQSRQCPRWLVAHCSSFLSSAPHSCLAGCVRRWRCVASTPAPPAVAEPPVAASRGQPCQTASFSTVRTTRSLRVAVPFSVCIAEPS